MTPGAGGGAAAMHHPLVELPGEAKPPEQDLKMISRRRTVREYRIWGKGLRGTLRFLVQVTGTVWTEIYTQLISLVLLTVGAYMFHKHVSEFDMPIIGHQVVLVPMSFLLVFRCSNSYQRYWDGRSLLGLLVFHSRELASKAYIYPAIDPVRHGVESEEDITRLELEIGALSSSIKRYVVTVGILINLSVSGYWDKVAHDRESRKVKKQGGTGPGFVFALDKVKPHLTPQEFEDLSEVAKNHPLLLLVWIRQEVSFAESRGFLTPYQSLDMSQSIGDLQQVWNGMLKITSTPLPYPWVHLSRLILYVFLVSLIPTSITQMSWGAIPFVLVTAFLFLGLVQIGNEMEDPFGDDINDFDLDGFEKTVQDDVALIHKTQDRRMARRKATAQRQQQEGIGSGSSQNVFALPPSSVGAAPSVQPPQRLQKAPSKRTVTGGESDVASDSPAGGGLARHSSSGGGLSLPQRGGWEGGSTHNESAASSPVGPAPRSVALSQRASHSSQNAAAHTPPNRTPAHGHARNIDLISINDIDAANTGSGTSDTVFKHALYELRTLN